MSEDSGRRPAILFFMLDAAAVWGHDGALDFNGAQGLARTRKDTVRSH